MMLSRQALDMPEERHSRLRTFIATDGESLFDAALDVVKVGQLWPDVMVGQESYTSHTHTHTHTFAAHAHKLTNVFHAM